MINVKVEEKPFQNRYRVDAGRPHINISDPEICQVECKPRNARCAATPRKGMAGWC